MTYGVVQHNIVATYQACFLMPLTMNTHCPTVHSEFLRFSKVWRYMIFIEKHFSLNNLHALLTGLREASENASGLRSLSQLYLPFYIPVSWVSHVRVKG